MVGRTLALLLTALAVRTAAAASFEIRVLPETTAVPLVVPGVAAVSSILGAGVSVPALSAAAPEEAGVPAALPVAEPAASGCPARPTATAVAAAQPLQADGVFDGQAARLPSDKELRALFAAAMPKSRAVAVFNRMGRFTDAAQQITSQYTFLNEHLLANLESDPNARGPRGPAFVQAVKDLVAVADARQDPASRRFVEALGRVAAHKFFLQQRAIAKRTAPGAARAVESAEGRHLPRNSLGSGDYWDMASGVNAARFIMNELEPGTRYSFIDVSPFVVSYLKKVAELRGADVSVLEGDVRNLTRPSRPLAVLRSKNAVAYVPNFEKKLEEMADWIAPGGRLVLQNELTAGHRELIIRKHSPLALRLLQQGWELSIEFAAQPGAEHALDTLIFTRPKAAAKPRTTEEALGAWSRYITAAHRANQSEMLRFFFR